ncbi:MAG: hypothetical protein IV107_03905 [Paucibacter sp.]|nr:hypothetical protein [Roseateles sp.]
MTDQETILAEMSAQSLVLTTICRMLPPHQRAGLAAAVVAAEGAILNSTLSDEGAAFMLERARFLIGAQEQNQ